MYQTQPTLSIYETPIAVLNHIKNDERIIFFKDSSQVGVVFNPAKSSNKYEIVNTQGDDLLLQVPGGPPVLYAPTINMETNNPMQIRSGLGELFGLGYLGFGPLADLEDNTEAGIMAKYDTIKSQLLR